MIPISPITTIPATYEYDRGMRPRNELTMTPRQAKATQAAGFQIPNIANTAIIKNAHRAPERPQSEAREVCVSCDRVLTTYQVEFDCRDPLAMNVAVSSR